MSTRPSSVNQRFVTYGRKKATDICTLSKVPYDIDIIMFVSL